jgi:chorismate mutase/prephenate dehydratase
MENTDLRRQIDEIDDKIVQLFSKRMDVSAEIAAYKQRNSLPIRDPKREREKVAHVLEKTPEAYKDYTYSLFSLLMELSRSYQGRLSGFGGDVTNAVKKAVESTDKLFPSYATVACQGIEGANSQIACDRLFKNANILYFKDFDAVFSAIEKGMCTYGVVPVENSSAGTVNKVYDLMTRHNFYIVRSVRTKIEHNLLAKPGVKMEDVREIYSHEQAINQCSKFLSSLRGVRAVPCENTAMAAQMVAESPRNDIAALASRPCIKLYGLNCLREDVQNVDNNYPRFICISTNLEIYPGADKTSVMLTLPHEQGSLYKLLSKLYALGINLNKLESRPLPNRDFEFMFYFDLDSPVYAPNLMQCIGEMKAACDSFTYLGSYSELM